MVVTRSMSGTTQRVKSGSSQEEVDVENSVKHKYALRATRKSAKSRVCDFDEMTMALGFFLDTWKKEHQKNDQDFRFTHESYQAATHDFNSLNDSSKAAYIAQAKERLVSLGINAIPGRPRKKRSKPRKSDLHRTLEIRVHNIFMRAVIQEYRNLNGIKTMPLELLDAAIEDFMSLSDEDKAPYIGQAMREYPDEPAAIWKCTKTVDGGVEKNVYYRAWS